MRSLQLNNTSYQQLETGFGQWLHTLNYHPNTANYSPLRIREFLHWLEQQGIPQVKRITEKEVKDYHRYLSHRKNHRREGGLSADYLNMHLTSLKQFSNYLQQTRESGFTIGVTYQPSGQRLEILTKSEIKSLYRAVSPGLLGLRDQARLSGYYGCGLRRNEGVGLDVKDVLWGSNLLHVRKGKNYKERYVPVTNQIMNDLKEYVEISRPHYTKSASSSALLLSKKGGRITGGALMDRFKLLLDKSLIGKTATLHTLRHSIATHLLQEGMSLYHIARFLGHNSLSSTQLYTHIYESA